MHHKFVSESAGSNNTASQTTTKQIKLDSAEHVDRGHVHQITHGNIHDQTQTCQSTSLHKATGYMFHGCVSQCFHQTSTCAILVNKKQTLVAYT